MNKIIALVICFFLLANAAFAGKMTTTDNKKGVEVSYVQTSSVTDIKAIPGQPDNYVVKLRNVTPYITYFSDRPNRVIGQIQTVDFLNIWKQGSDSFSKDAPNAVLSGVNKTWTKNRNVNLVVELTQPEYNAADQTLSYHAHVLKDANTPAVNFSKLHYTTLFIDGFVCLSCIGG